MNRVLSVTDVTALWNTNAFFAYVFTTVLTGAKWDTRRLAGVVIATAGALAVVYGGSAASADKADTSDTSQSMSQGRAALVGDLMTLVGSIAYAAYQVYYKLRAALPNDPEVYAEHYAPLDDSADFLPDDEENQEDTALRAPDVDDVIRPLPFGLYPNLLTSLIGVCTLLVFWVPVPLLDAWGIVPFEMPRDAHTYLVIAGIAVTGSVFNAGFMVRARPRGYLKSSQRDRHGGSRVICIYRSCWACGAPSSHRSEACSRSCSSSSQTSSLATRRTR